jgi:hypothetical protein
MKPTLLPPGPHPGFGKLKSQPGVYRCKLRAVASKAKPEFADYSGTLFLAGGQKASVLAWVHQDQTIGLRVEMLK